MHTSNGSIRVADLHGDLEAETSGNSSIDMEGVEGDSRVHTSNGSILRRASGWSAWKLIHRIAACMRISRAPIKPILGIDTVE